MTQQLCVPGDTRMSLRGTAVPWPRGTVRDTELSLLGGSKTKHPCGVEK